jgi:beta-galactosidase
MVGGTESSLSKLGNAERDSLLGLHRAFLERQIPVDFVSPRDITGNGIDQYKILFLPYSVMLSRAVAAGIKRYVENGGNAVAEARLAWNDERGFASEVIPGLGLSEVFGAREKLIRPVDKPQISMEASSKLPGIAAGQQAAGAAFEEDLDPSPGAQVRGRFPSGEPAIVENSFGKGTAIIIGSFTGLAYDRDPEDSTRQMLLSFAQAAGVSPEVEVSGNGSGEVEVRRLVTDRRQILFIFNHADAPADAVISVRLPWSVREATNLESGRTTPVRQSEGTVSLEQTIPGEQILVLRLER